MSDTHNHNWSAFATTTPEGVNSRLRATLDETVRCAGAVVAAGGDTIYHGGDLFHVRGSIAPSVLNPTLDTYRALINGGMKIVINAGNHDLEGKEASRMSSAITALEGIGCTVINKPTIHYVGAGSDMMVIPWIPNIAELKAAIETTPEAERADLDLLIHAPIDGVIPGLPDHGLDAGYLAALGYRRVFAGHYHNHKDLGGSVYSIGSLTHQTWSDIDAKAGFLVVTDEGVKWHATHAPSFVEIDASTKEDEVPLIVDGNYVRVKINSAKLSDVEAMRAYLMSVGAKGVVVLPDVKVATVARTGSTLKAGSTLESSINDYINAQSYKEAGMVAALCQDILTTVRSVT